MAHYHGLLAGDQPTITVAQNEAGDRTVRAVIGFTGRTNRNSDYLVPGGLRESTGVRMSYYAHGAIFGGGLPVAIGGVTENDNRLIYDGVFNPDLAAANEVYAALAFGQAQGQPERWSGGWDTHESAFIERDGEFIREHRAYTFFEASPVAGPAWDDTRTISLAGVRDAVAAQSADLESERRRRQGVMLASLRGAYDRIRA